MKGDNYTNVILEEILSRYQTITALVSDVPHMKEDVSQLKHDVAAIKDDMASIKTIVGDHEDRIITLEIGQQPA